ncbi:hypothetical protein MNEG_8866 [Monoraphidium neglectum]|uniref:Uncharacterized protein n=1 Tax=Monoraphidium neglectum TaxID=145388 RepID=A0A0D2M6T7_9CHLO|nr:hypothetical protein MNEG_8866 [Monoraphidium neglectum]KIY99094.1 hypothetical protein MNEG_8866 [Monoraphidium neglectum]|eukprot:XP_013898114.1 hypothetical protein MNEG_8866 [Monoraphidium neglectum]
MRAGPPGPAAANAPLHSHGHKCVTRSRLRVTNTKRYSSRALREMPGQAAAAAVAAVVWWAAQCWGPAGPGVVPKSGRAAGRKGRGADVDGRADEEAEGKKGGGDSGEDIKEEERRLRRAASGGWAAT